MVSQARARSCLMAAAGLLAMPADAASAVPDVILNNGVRMPSMAFAAQVWHPDTCLNATTEALEAGFRFVWSSMLVGADCQRAQGQAMSSSGLSRHDLFIAGTVNTQDCIDHDNCYEHTRQGAEQQFEVLGVHTLDMLMLDYPSTGGCDSIAGQWAALEELYKANKTRSIAVSNFDSDQLHCIIGEKHMTVPSANQLKVSIGHWSPSAVSENEAYGIAVQSYSPLGTGALVHDELCTKIGAAHKKTAVQVALKWVQQHCVSVATQSTNPQHLRDDLDIFDFDLTDEEMASLDARLGGVASPLLV